MRRRHECEGLQDSGLSRRELLQIGGIGLGSLGLEGWGIPEIARGETRPADFFG